MSSHRATQMTRLRSAGDGIMALHLILPLALFCLRIRGKRVYGTRSVPTTLIALGCVGEALPNLRTKAPEVR